MTDYLRLAQERAPQTPEEQDNPYLPLARQQQELQQNRARTVIESALKDDPDLAAERLRLSQTAGLPPDVVQRNFDELKVKERARAVDLVRMAEDSPVLYRQLVDPTFATTSVDDLDTLGNLERSVAKGVRYVMGADAKGGLPKDVAGAAVDIGLGATAGVGEMVFNVAGTLYDLVGWQSGAQSMRGFASRSQAARQSFGLQAESSTGKAVKAGLQSSGTNLALLPLGLARGLFATANQAASAVAGAMATGVGADAYLRAREQGLTQVGAAKYAIPEAAFEYVFERIPASKLFGDIAANTGLLKTIGKQTLSEGWTEQVTTLAQDFNEWMNLNPNKTLGEFIQERPEAAYQTFVATLVGVGVQTSTIKGINKIVEQATNRSLQFDQDLLQQQMQLAAASMLRQRSPEQFRAHVQQVVDANEGAKAEIYVDAEVLNQLPQELLAQLPESVREALPDALDANSTVAIPMADVLTVAPGTELEQILNDNARMRPNAASRVEAQLTEQYLQQEADRVLQQAADTQAWQQSSEAVRTTLLDQLNATGRFTPDVNEAYATLQANFFSTMAARTGLTPTELYDRYSLKVAAKQAGQGGVLNAGRDTTYPEYLPTDKLTQEQLLARGSDGHLQFARERYIPVDKIDGLEPTPGASDERGYEPGRPITQPIEVVYDRATDSYMLYAGNHRVTQAKLNGDTHIRAFVQPDGGTVGASATTLRSKTNLPSGVLNQSASQTDTPAFKRWFGGSQAVVAVNAKTGAPAVSSKEPIKLVPQVMYHTTRNDFTEFEIGRITKNSGTFGDWETSRAAVFVTPDLEASQAYGTQGGEFAPGANVMPLYIKAENPLDLTGGVSEATERKLLDAGMSQGFINNELGNWTMFDGEEGRAVVDAIKQAGFDSVIFNDQNPDTGDSFEAYALFNPTQIKSAIGNRGAFDPTDPNVLNQSTVETHGLTREDAAAIIEDEQDPPEGWYVHGRKDGATLSDNWPIQLTQNSGVANGYAGSRGSVWAIRPNEQTKTADFSDYYGDDLNGFIESLQLLFDDQKTETGSSIGLVVNGIADRDGVSPADVTFSAFEDYVRGVFTPSKIVESAGAFDDSADMNLLEHYPGGWPDMVITPDGAVVMPGAANKTDSVNLTALHGALNQEPLAQGPRGTFSPEQLLLTLNENADLSTFLHESGHFFLEVLADLASQPDAPQQIQDDMAATLKWFGVPDLATWNGYTLDQKRQYHERWAESFEQYLFEGKAPNEELQPLFRRFRSWMVNVYKSLTQFMRERNLNLNDEVRQVFGRLIATDEQIAQAEEAAGMLPDFEATNEAIEQLQARSLRDLKWTVNARNKAIKALQKEAKDLRKGVEAEVRAEVEQQPLYKAMNWLKKGETIDPETGDLVKAEKGFRLSTEALAEMYPETMLGRPDLTRLRGMTGKEGLHPDMVADMFGFQSGDQLVRAILDAEPIASVIEGMTDQRMLERHGDLATPEAIEAAANEAVHNEARAKSLATELKAQAEMMSQRQDTGRTASNGRPITVNAITNAAKQFALNLAARRRLKDLKNAAWQHRSAEARAGKAWQAATAKGDTQAAVQAKRDQLLNNYAAKALQDAQAEVKKTLEFFKRVVKGNDEKIVKRGRDPDVVNAMRAILAAYDVAPRLEKSALAYMETVAKNDPAMYAALKPSVDGAMLNAKPLTEMTLEELRGLADELRAMWALAKRSRQMEVDGNLMDIEDAADELMARMEDIGIPDEVPGERGAITDKQERGIKLQFAKAILSRVEQWSERLDGKFGGPFLRLVFQPVKDAADRYRTDRTEYRKKFTELLKNVAPYLPAGPIDAPELGYTFGNARDSGAAELLHAILHTGNDSNKRKLLLGRNWASENGDGTLETGVWDAFIDRLINEGKLNKAHYDFAQGVWDLLEEMKPLAQETHRKVFGRYFAEVTANEVVTPFGTYRGGYVPAQTDSRLVKDAKLRELAEGENESMAYAFPAAPSGFTKSRVEYNKPLLLDLRALAQHMDKVLLFSHMQGAVTDVRRLLTNKRVSYALDRIDPGAYEGMLIPWLNRSARQVVETPVVGDRKLSRFLSAARSRAGMALMFANLSNTMQQITGFSMAAVKVKPGLMMQAAARFVADPKAVKTTVADASPYMKDRMLNEVGAMNDAVEEILVNPTLLERGQAWTQRHAYFLQAAIDNTMSPIIWTAAYNQAIAEGQSERDAVRFADGVVRQTQGTTLPEDVSRFETGPGYARLFTQFVSYFNMMANTNATAVSQIVGEMGLKKGAGKLLYVAMAGLLAPIWVAEAIAQAFRGGPEDDEGDGWLDDWLMAVFGLGTIRGLVAQVPIVGQAAQLVVNRFNDNPADDKFSLSPAVSLIESAVSSPASVYKAIMEDGNKQKAVRDVATAATLLTGLPIFGAARPLGYLAGLADERIEPTGPVDLARGLVTGTASAESRVP